MSVVCYGELLIDFVSTEQGVSVGDAPGFIKAPGGAPANVAVAVAKLGHPAAFLGMVGEDPFGRYLEGVLRGQNVETRGLRFNTTARTALAFVSNDAHGDRTFSFYRNPSADMLMTPADVALDVIDAHRVFHYGSLTMITEPARSAQLAAMTHARAAGKLMSYDPNLRLPLWDSPDAARAGMIAGLDYAHVLKITDEELVFMTGGDDIAPLWRPDMRLICVTRGEGGATIYTRSDSASLSAFKVQAVDTTGAGDGFVAGVLVKLLELGDDFAARLPEIVRFANAVGAIATTQKGAIPALPTRAAVEAFLAAHP